MPNTPALVNQGCSVFVRGTSATESDAELTQTLFESIGTCEEIPESLMDPVTALSGSGPAYVFVMIEALADGAVNMGLPRDMAYRLAAQTVLGSGLLVRDSKRHPGQLKDDVTSPAGSTAAGLSHLEKNGMCWQISANKSILANSEISITVFVFSTEFSVSFNCSRCCGIGRFAMQTDQ